MIDPTAKLSVSRLAIVLGISRGSVYYRPRPVPADDLKLMHRIDNLHMEFPFAGSRMLQGLLVRVHAYRLGQVTVAGFIPGNKLPEFWQYCEGVEIVGRF